MTNVLNFVKNQYIQQKQTEEQDRHALVNSTLLHGKGPIGSSAKSYEAEWEAFCNTVETGIFCFLSEVESSGTEEEKFAIYKEIEMLSWRLGAASFDARTELPNSFSHQMLNAIYSCAKKAVASGSTSNAIAIFRLLTLLIPNYFDTWIGLGISCQLAGDVPEALAAYERAKNLRPDHPLHAIYTAECLLRLNDRMNAQAALNEALQLINQSDTFKHLLAEAHRVQSIIQMGNL